jgi:hypothetical protein
VAVHPFIGVRGDPDSPEAYVVGTGRSVDELTELVRAAGSVESAAALAGLDQRLIQAAVDYSKDAAVPHSRAKPTPKTNVVQMVTQAFGLIAGFASIVYVAGAVVLTGRFAFEGLPWEPVVGQLPRVFVVSTGAGQVVLPAAIVAALYAMYRLLRRERPSAPVLARWRDGWPTRPSVMKRYVGAALLLSLPAVAVVVVRLKYGPTGDGPSPWWLLAAYGAVLVPAIAFHEVRAILAKRYGDKAQWNSVRAAALMTGLYGAVAAPAVMVAAIGLQLNDAKVCTTGDFEERGVLVGQTADSVYLGEQKQKHQDRRIAVVPRSQVAEMFIGHGAAQADCDFGDARSALVAALRVDAARRAAHEASDAVAALGAARSDSGLIADGKRVADAAGRAGLATLAIADLGDRVHAGGQAPARESGDRALTAVQRLRSSLDELRDGRDDAARHEQVRARAAQAVRSARAAADAAAPASGAILDAARRRQPAPG